MDSDIDAMIIVNEEMHADLRKQNKLTECIFGRCTYESGYFDLKYFTKEFLLNAAQKGSEPTRNSFIGTKCIFSRDNEISEIIKKIPIYPVWEKADKIISFYSTFFLNQFFFWGEAQRLDDLYLKSKVASDIVLFGLRMLLAYNEKLFPCHKWLTRIVNELDLKPENIVEKANIFLEKLDDESKKVFVDSILSFTDWQIPKNITEVLNRFVEDNELWWDKYRPNIAEW